LSRPEVLLPGMPAAVTEEPPAGDGADVLGADVTDVDSDGFQGPLAAMGVGGRDMLERLAVEEARVGMAGVMDGVGGPEEAGEGVSTTHILLRISSPRTILKTNLCDRVATSLATVCARVEYGLTLKTG
jgi:hypothetical protein